MLQRQFGNLSLLVVSADVAERIPQFFEFGSRASHGCFQRGHRLLGSILVLACSRDLLTKVGEFVAKTVNLATRLTDLVRSVRDRG